MAKSRGRTDAADGWPLIGAMLNRISGTGFQDCTISNWCPHYVIASFGIKVISWSQSNLHEIPTPSLHKEMPFVVAAEMITAKPAVILDDLFKGCNQNFRTKRGTNRLRLIMSSA